VFVDVVKSQKSEGTVKSSRCKARESLGMRRTYQYVAMTKDEAQSRHGGTDGLFTKPSVFVVFVGFIELIEF
jgi:hypothetical protein